MFDRIKTILEPLNVGIYNSYVPPNEKTPPNYVVILEYRKQSLRNSDGVMFINQSSIQLDVFELWTNDYNLSKEVETKLIENKINYTKLNLGYLSDLKKTQVTFEFILI